MWQTTVCAFSDSPSDETYSLVLTSPSGARTFGYCRRIRPEGAGVIKRDFF